MVTNESFRELAMSFPDVLESPHFDKASFKINKKIFATFAEIDRVANVKLSPENQTIFCASDENIVFPIPNKWGQQGWTSINLKNIDNQHLKEIIQSAYIEVSTKKVKNSRRKQDISDS